MKIEDDPVLFTQKFWSHVKSNSKSIRLLETMHLNNRFRNKPSENKDIPNYLNFDCGQYFPGTKIYHFSWKSTVRWLKRLSQKLSQ